MIPPWHRGTEMAPIDVPVAVANEARPCPVSKQLCLRGVQIEGYRPKFSDPSKVQMWGSDCSFAVDCTLQSWTCKLWRLP